MTPMTEKKARYFWAKVNKDGRVVRPELGPCWEWTAAKNPKGYGEFGGVPGRTHLAYRLLFEDVRGPVPPGMQLDHLCRNKGCVNPDHLEVVTPRENSFRARKTHCKRGHELAGDNLLSVRRGEGRRCRACTREYMLVHGKRYSANRRQKALCLAREQAADAAFGNVEYRR